MKMPHSIQARNLLRLAGVLVVLGASIYFYHPFLVDSEGKPNCHKILDGSFQQWMAEAGNRDSSPTNALPNFVRGVGKEAASYFRKASTKPYPNVRGVGKDSLDTIRDMVGQIDWPKDYNYVPGLREQDPAELVLMYFNRPTRWVWHGSEPTIFARKAWIIMNVDFSEGSGEESGWGECSERVSTEEFKRRLRATLDYLKKNQRPYWETVVAEHTRFLQSLEINERGD